MTKPSLSTYLVALFTGLFFAGPASSAAEPESEKWPEEVVKLVKELESPDKLARRDAILKLRRFAGRVDRSGAQRKQTGGISEPKVKGLVPALVKASDDSDDLNRQTALFALADTLDPAAVVAIKKRLKDENQSVRFHAACFLTEFQDISGLVELKQAMARFRENPDSDLGFDIERLLAALERATGKSFGEIPLSPALASDGRVAAAAKARYAELLDNWTDWYNWTPDKK